MKAWAVVNKSKPYEIVQWKSLSDDEEGLEIHRTRQLARAACFNDETVIRVKVEIDETQ